MANSIAYAQKFLPIIDEVYKAAAVTEGLDAATQVDTAGVNEVKILKVSTTGMGDYIRENGYPAGDVTAAWETVKLEIERGKELSVDRMDNEETLGVVFGQVVGSFMREHVVPEVDAYRFAKYAGATGITSKAETLTASTFITAVDEAVKVMDAAEVPAEMRALYINSDLKPFVHQAFNRMYGSDSAISNELNNYNGTPIKYVPKSRFYDKITLNSGATAWGFAPGTGAKALNFMLIDSPNIDLYGVHEGYRDYDITVTDAASARELKAKAMWEFDEGNEDRIDMPQITITGKVIDLSKLSEYGELEKIELGDTVHVIDNDGTEYTERVIEGVWYPYESTQTTLSIGHMRRDLFFTLYQLQHKKQELEKVQTTGKAIKTRALSGNVNSDRNNVQSDNELLKIVGDLLTIYGDVGGRKQKRLELGNVDGEFALNIYDSDENKGKNRLKIKLGDHGDDYAFAIYNDKGNAAIYMDENGEIILSGRISTSKNAEVGTNIVVGKNSASGRIDFAGMINQSEGYIQVIDHEMDIVCDYVRINGIDILQALKNINNKLE